MLPGIITLIKKEIVLEWRLKTAFNGILLYLVSTVFVCYLSFGQIVSEETWNALFWIIILFASVNISLKGFVQEKKGLQLYYYTLAYPQAVILSKIIYHSVLMILVSWAGAGIYASILGNPVANYGLFLLNMTAGVMALASVLSLVSAIAAKAGNNFTLVAVLGFPLTLPLLLVLIKNSAAAINGDGFMAVAGNFLIILLLCAITIVLSVILFPYIWKE